MDRKVPSEPPASARRRAVPLDLDAVRARAAAQKRAGVLAQPRRAGRHARASRSSCTASSRARRRSGRSRATASSRRRFLKLMGASLALAGVTACTSQPPEKIVPYVKQPEEIVPGKPLFFATAMTLGGVGDRRARREPRGAADQDRGQPRAPGEPRRDRRLRAGRVLEPLRPRPLADDHRTSAASAPGQRLRRDARRRARCAPAGARRRGAPHPDRRRSPRRRSPARSASSLDALPEGALAPVGAGRRREHAAPARVRAFGEAVDARYDLDARRRDPGARRRLPRPTARARVRYARDFADGRRVRERADRRRR